jgi:cyclopropane fatty-acyl-phospholipid synthase-like methyltransferase
LKGFWKYVKATYRNRTGNGIFFSEGELPMCSLLPEKVLQLCLDLFHPKTMIDLGCGTGRTVKWFADRGVESLGVEGSSLAISHSPSGISIIHADLRKGLDIGKKFDLVWSFEVAEHLPAKYADIFVETLCRLGNSIVISAAKPDQPGEGHFNCQPAEYWIEKFASRGFQLDQIRTDLLRATRDLLSENLMVFIAVV